MGADYARPDVTLTATWKEREQDDYVVWKLAEPAVSMPKQWWLVFEDEPLNGLEEQALSANQELKIAMARVDQARALARLEKANLLPRADINPSTTRAERSNSSFGGSGSFLQTTHELPLDLSYEVDLWGKVRRSFEAVRAEAAASESAYQSVLLTLTAEVARTYFDLRELDAEYRVLAETLVLRGNVLDIVEQRFDAGLVSELDLVRAKTEMAAAETVLVDVRRRRAELENALAVLCGENPSSFSLAVAEFEVTAPHVPAGIPSTLLERRPDVAEAERQVMAANARIGVAKTAFFPVLRLTGSAGFQSPELEDLLNTDSVVWSLGPSLQIPIFTGGRGKSNLEAAEAVWTQTVAAYRQQVLLAFRDVEDALVNIAYRQAQQKTQARVVSGAQESAAISQERYKQGLIDYIEVVDAERLRLNAELDAVRFQNQQLKATVLLIKALGGQWD